MELKQIAHIENDFPAKFGLPHQSGRIPSLAGRVIFEPEYRNPAAFAGIEEYSCLWLIWEFSGAIREGWSPTVRPPRLGGNVRKGVFATRSPFRPNPLGLSAVKLDRLEFDRTLGPVLYVSGLDMMNGTPVFDIKPYLPYVDSRPKERGGFTDRIADHKLAVDFPRELLAAVPEATRETLLAVLADDPRPGYQNDPERIYGMAYKDLDIHFRVDGETLLVTDVSGATNPDRPVQKADGYAGEGLL